MRRARAGEQLAFGLLYLRHQDAAWRVANAVSRFSPQADEVVVEAFAMLLASAPHSRPRVNSLRSELLACVRRVALARDTQICRGGVVPAFTTERSSAPRHEIRLRAVEPAVTAALRGLNEPERTALWLTEVEAFTPQETGDVMEVQPEEAAALARRGRLELRLALAHIFAKEGTVACRAAAFHVVAAGKLGPVDPDLAQHLERCQVCRIRRAEAADVPATLRSVIPPSPLLGRPCQRRWRRRRNRMAGRTWSPTGPLPVALPVLLSVVVVAAAWWALGR